jgi:prevent-host-death family protein
LRHFQPEGNFFNVKSVTVEQVEENFAAVLRFVRAGEEVEVTRRKKPIARIVPLSKRRPKHDWNGHFARLNKIYGGKSASGISGSQIVLEGRR